MMGISKENRNMEAATVVKDAIDNRVTSAKKAVHDALVDANDPEFAKSFADLNPEQRAFGLLQGKLMSAKGNKDIEEAFGWYAVEYKDKEWYKEFGLHEKVLVLQHMTTLVGGVTDETYRAVRKIFVTVNQGD
jgi:hypothetical protein